MTAVPNTCEAVMAQLEAWGSEGFRRIYAKGGAGDRLFGVKMGDLRGLAKKLKTNHELGLQLWATGNVDAMVLATIILSGPQLSAADLEAMLQPLTYYRLVDEFVDNVVTESPHAEALRPRWMDSPEALVGRAGWSLQRQRIRHLDADGPDIPALLARIEAEILSAPTLKQEAINYCLVQIALDLPDRRAACIALAEKLGRFDKRPVPKGCTSSYAPEWIAAVLARKNKSS